MNSLEKLLADIKQQAKSRRYVDMVADALIFRLSIPVGNQLVMVLGNGMARNNREAVRQWVEAEMSKIEEADVVALQAELARRLYVYLNQAQDGDVLR